MKLISLKIINLICLTLFICGCAKNHRVHINPSIPIHNSKIGNGLPVVVKVVDIRPSNIISKWQGGFKVRKFTVLSQGDLKDIFTTRVQEGLSKLGFFPKNRHFKTDRIFKFELINIKSRYQENIPSMNIQIKADAKATCQNQGKELSRVFTTRISRSNITPTSCPNEMLLNDCLSELMGKVFNDPALIACLSE